MGFASDGLSGRPETLYQAGTATGSDGRAGQEVMAAQRRQDGQDMTLEWAETVWRVGLLSRR